MDMVSNRETGKDFHKLGTKSGPGKNALYFLVSASNEQYQHTKDELETMMLKVGFQISSMSGFGEFVVGLK